MALLRFGIHKMQLSLAGSLTKAHDPQITKPSRMAAQLEIQEYRLHHGALRRDIVGRL